MIDLFPLCIEKPVGILGEGKTAASIEDACHAANIETRKPPFDENEDLEFLVISPGYPMTHEVIVDVKKRGIEVIGDIELFFRAMRFQAKPIIAITGTNGKSTTTALIAHILTHAGKRVGMGGNIGVAALTLPPPEEVDVYVLEISSYQLESCHDFAPDIAALLNITPDHLDRHGTMDNYAAAKAKVFKGIGTAIICTDDSLAKKIADTLDDKKRLVPVSVSAPQYSHLDGFEALRGPHNHQNAAIAYAVCLEAGCAPERILGGLETFPGLDHRQKTVREIGSVLYVNDSKATNAEATAMALQSFDMPIYWILGGVAKKTGLSGLEKFAPKIAHAYLIGEAAKDFALWMDKQNIPYTLCGTLDRATRTAHDHAVSSGETSVVLLSPAAASFDQFENFELRGKAFADLVNSLTESNA